jgi:hypothetical protein
MTRKNRRCGLPEEVRIVTECSPNLMPCKKFLHANIYRFADHMKNDRCKPCIAWFQQTDKTANDSTVGGVAEEHEQLSRVVFCAAMS